MGKATLSIVIGLIVIVFSAAGEPIPGIVLGTIIGAIWGAFAAVKSRVHTERGGVTTSVEATGVGYVPVSGATTNADLAGVRYMPSNQTALMAHTATPQLDEGGVEAQLLTLKSWFDRGLIGPTEYAAKKAELLSRWKAPPKLSETA